MELNEIKKISEIIRNNKKYSSISEDVITDEIESYFRKSPNKLAFLEKQKSEKFKKIIKEIRAELHKVYGSFQTEEKKHISDILRQIKRLDDYEVYNKILSASVSSKERLKNYRQIYECIFSITGKPRSVLDLGCGLNPVSYPYMNLTNLDYYAYDIDKGDIGFLNEYFRLMKRFGLNGKASAINLLKNNIELPKADVCFLFKVIDPLERGINHKLSEFLIKMIDCKFIVVSFSTKTISGKPMNYPYRGWIERMLTRINFKFEKMILENEVFYIINK
jgi:16S rRNA (guanine(1405)-N(7))-methyltransferase